MSFKIKNSCGYGSFQSIKMLINTDNIFVENRQNRHYNYKFAE